MLSQDTINIITATVPVIEQHGATVTDVFYRNILRENPALNEVFNQGNQASGHQAKALATAVLAYAKYITTPEVLGPAIKHITQKHASLFIQPEAYAVVGKYLLEAFAEVLGDAFNSQIRNAWAEAYGQLAQIMIDAEAKLYKDSGDWTNWRDFVVREKTQESSDIQSFVLSPKDGKPLPSYLPGQYVSIRVMVPSLGYTQTRQYSLSDSYVDDHYRISVRREPGVCKDDVQHPGLVSTILHTDVNSGDTVQLSKPQGVFSLDTTQRSTTPLVLISAGVGLTPMVSMLNTVLVDAPSRPVTWINGTNTSQKRAFSNHINQMVNTNEQIRVMRFLTKPTDSDKLKIDYEQVGRVDLTKCDPSKHLYLEDQSTQYYICGPELFMDSVQKQLAEYGVEKARVFLERFGTGGF